MNIRDSKYSRYALVHEMLETVDVVNKFRPDRTQAIARAIKINGKLFLTGEGSSRIFPAKNMIHKARRWSVDVTTVSEGARQASKYDLSDWIVFCASNSGQTNEVISLVKNKNTERNNYYALTAKSNTLLEKLCHETFLLECGWETAVAATKSVVEQALFYEAILWHILDKKNPVPEIRLGEKIASALSMQIDEAVIESAARASTIYFAGFNDGVAEELTLKTNEITRKKSDYLEGTYAVHGIEEVLEKNDILFIIDPIEEETEKFKKVLVDGVGMNVVALSTRQTIFPTIVIPDAGMLDPYVYLCAGWNILVEIGLKLGINLDKPNRARKVGNEFVS
jgi:glutamine---fructose-6-phosphate transaminase (isomerizing)